MRLMWFTVLARRIGSVVETHRTDELVEPFGGAARVTADHHPRWHIPGDHRAGPDQRARSDAHARQDGRVRADPGVAFDVHSAEALRDVRAAGEGRVGERDPGTDPGPGLQHRVLRNEALRVDPYTVADRHMVFNDAERSDRHVVADAVVFPDQRVVAGLEPFRDRVARVQPGVAAQPRPGREPFA